jgi:type VI secretion system protein ImpJ
MAAHGRVIWSEGLFLRPQHFQQQDRCFELLVRQSCQFFLPYFWGFRSLEIEAPLLETGKFGLRQCQGVLPDGTPFSAPDEHAVPTPLDISGETRNKTVYLAAPIERSALAADALTVASDGIPRLEASEIEVYDVSQDSLGSRAAITIGRLKLALKLEGDAIAGYHLVPVARIIEVGTDRRVMLDENFIPACINYRVSRHLTDYLRDLLGRLRRRGENLAERISTSGRGSVAEVVDVLLLQIVNRVEPQVAHLVEAGGHHPEDLFRFFLGIAGELATFTTTSQRAGAYPAYDHDNLIGCFRPVEDAIRVALDWMREPTATSIPIEELQYGIRRAVIGDQALLASGTFVLEVSADMEADTLMKAFRAQSKFGPQDKIRELVVQALPGIPIRARMNAPRQLPYHVNAVYFEIDTGHDLWKGIEQTGILTLHVAGTFPNLALTLWALKR